MPLPFAKVRSVALDLTPLKISVPYRALWTGQLVSLIGTNMRLVAVAYQVFQITGSPVAVGLIGLVEVVPIIAFAIVGGAIADRMDRRALLIRTQLALMATSVVLALVSLGRPPSVGILYLLVGISAALTAIDQPTRSALAPSLVPGHTPALMALRQVNFQITQILGPAIGGVVIQLVDVAGVYLIDAVTFLIALTSLRWVPPRPPETQQEKTELESIREGLRFAFRTPLLLSIFTIDLIAMIFGMPRAVFPALAENTFQMGAAGLGLLYAAPSAGALVGALTSGWVKRVARQGVGVIVAVIAWGSAITLAGLAVFSLPLTLFFLALAGAADVVSAVFRGTIVIETTPDELRGRIIAVNIMVVTGGPRLGDVEAGVVAGLVGAPASIVIGGVACLLGTAGVAAGWPSLRSYRAEREEARAPVALPGEAHPGERPAAS